MDDELSLITCPQCDSAFWLISTDMTHICALCEYELDLDQIRGDEELH